MPVRRIVVPGSDYASAQFSPDGTNWAQVVNVRYGVVYNARTGEIITTIDPMPERGRIHIAGLEPGQPIRVEPH